MKELISFLKGRQNVKTSFLFSTHCRSWNVNLMHLSCILSECGPVFNVIICTRHLHVCGHVQAVLMDFFFARLGAAEQAVCVAQQLNYRIIEWSRWTCSKIAAYLAIQQWFSIWFPATRPILSLVPALFGFHQLLRKIQLLWLSIWFWEYYTQFIYLRLVRERKQLPLWLEIRVIRIVRLQQLNKQ